MHDVGLSKNGLIEVDKIVTASIKELKIDINEKFHEKTIHLNKLEENFSEFKKKTYDFQKIQAESMQRLKNNHSYKHLIINFLSQAIPAVTAYIAIYKSFLS